MTQNTGISISLVILLVGGVLWIQTSQSNTNGTVERLALTFAHYKEMEGEKAKATDATRTSITAQFDGLKAQIGNLQTAIDKAQAEAWRRSDQRIFADQLRRGNEDKKLAVPEVE